MGGGKSPRRNRLRPFGKNISPEAVLSRHQVPERGE